MCGERKENLRFDILCTISTLGTNLTHNIKTQYLFCKHVLSAKENFRIAGMIKMNFVHPIYTFTLKYLFIIQNVFHIATKKYKFREKVGSENSQIS